MNSRHGFQKTSAYITDALYAGGKQMLCDIIKWTIIIIIAAAVFTVAYKIATNQDIYEQKIVRRR